MSFHPDLEAAGRRAAERPVIAGPTMVELESGAATVRRRRRVGITSGVAAGALAITLPLVLLTTGGGGDGPVEVVAAADPTVASSTDVDDSSTEGDAPEPDAAESAETDASVRVLIGPEEALAVRVVHGDEAASEADRAAAAADETRTHDGVEVWIERGGEEVSVSALVHTDVFVEVRGSSDLLDRLVDKVTDDDLFVPESFDRLPDLGEHFPFGPGELDEFFGERFELERFDDFSEVFPELEERLEEFFGDDGRFVVPDDFGFDPERLPDIDQFPEIWPGFDASCLEITVERDGDDGVIIRVPDDCRLPTDGE